MTLQECTALLTPLALALRTPMDGPTFRAYHRALKDVPVRLLQAAIDHAEKRPRDAYQPTFPIAPTLRAYAESARLALLKAVPHTGCEDCQGTGWRSVTVNRMPIAERCPCKQAHLDQLSALGLGPALAPPQIEAADSSLEPFDARMAAAEGR